MPTAVLQPDTPSTNGAFSSPPPPVPSKNPSSSSRHVLLLLDVQICNLSDPRTGVPDAANLRENILKVLEQARDSHPQPLIIHIRNSGDVGEPDEHGSKRWELMFPASEGELVVDKKKNNAFAGTELGDWIRDDAEIVVVGVMSDYSIRATCSAALDRGNEVILIRGAHGTYDRVEVLYGGGVTPAHDIGAEIEEELGEAGVHVLEMRDIQGIFMDR